MRPTPLLDGVVTMILSLTPHAWKTILDALEHAESNYRDIEDTKRADETRALLECLREIGRQTLHGRLQGYRFPGALDRGKQDIVIEAVPTKQARRR